MNATATPKRDVRRTTPPAKKDVLAGCRDAWKGIDKAERAARTEIRKALKRRDVSIRDLSAATGVPVTTLYRFANKGKS